jgi:hypothetical protein
MVSDSDCDSNEESYDQSYLPDHDLPFECVSLSLVGLTESAAEWRADGPSIRAARSAAAGGWSARPDADSVQPTAHQFPSIPRRAATAPFHSGLHSVRRLRSAERIAAKLRNGAA